MECGVLRLPVQRKARCQFVVGCVLSALPAMLVIEEEALVVVHCRCCRQWVKGNVPQSAAVLKRNCLPLACCRP